VQLQHDVSSVRRCPRCLEQDVKRTKMTSAWISFACEACGHAWDDPHRVRIEPHALKAALFPEPFPKVLRKVSR
jgi:ribosomal protein L37AE/L43A